MWPRKRDKTQEPEDYMGELMDELTEELQEEVQGDVKVLTVTEDEANELGEAVASNDHEPEPRWIDNERLANELGVPVKDRYGPLMVLLLSLSMILMGLAMVV